MPTLDEIASQTSSQLSGVLQSAVETISSGQEITFRMYVRKVLPIDGFVYWINAEIIDPAELSSMGISAPITKPISGSLHRQVIVEQGETTSRDVNNIIFTPTKRIDDFNIDSPDFIYIGEYQGTRFAFSRMESRYTQSGIFHYRGMAILPTMQSQLIDSAEDINTDQIISDSTSIWLTLSQFATVYPSFLIPANLTPPYIAVDVRRTVALQAGHIIYDGVRYQLAQDSVRVTLYGFNNEDALGYVDYVIRTALEDEQFGITNIPIPKDEKYTQVELNALAKRKTVDFEVNYYQQTTRDIARQLIKQVIVNYEVK